jgi:hypothetical protein
MNESMPSSAQPAQAAQKPRIWFGVRRDFGEAGKLSFYRASFYRAGEDTFRVSEGTFHAFDVGGPEA